MLFNTRISVIIIIPVGINFILHTDLCFEFYLQTQLTIALC